MTESGPDAKGGSTHRVTHPTATRNEVAQLEHALGELRQCVGILRSHYGESAQVRRLSNDLERLDIDAAEVTGDPGRAAPRARPVPREEMVLVPDAPYDPELWRDADDEGVGGYHRHG
jgi:hypothetical protein